MVLDAILADVHACGIDTISRSALGRYVPTLKMQDGLQAFTAEETIVTIVERSSGQVRIIKTSASAAMVAAQIEKMCPKKRGLTS